MRVATKAAAEVADTRFEAAHGSRPDLMLRWASRKALWLWARLWQPSVVGRQAFVPSAPSMLALAVSLLGEALRVNRPGKGESLHRASVSDR